jgi:hypothetical protein
MVALNIQYHGSSLIHDPLLRSLSSVREDPCAPSQQLCIKSLTTNMERRKYRIHILMRPKEKRITNHDAFPSGNVLEENGWWLYRTRLVQRRQGERHQALPDDLITTNIFVACPVAPLFFFDRVAPPSDEADRWYTNERWWRTLHLGSF